MQNRIARGFGLSLLLLGAFSFAGGSHADEPLPQDPIPVPGLADLVRLIIIDATKEGYVDEKHWNKSSERFDGLRIQGLRISKKKKSVQHGFCRKYAAELRNPENTFELNIKEASIPKENVIAFAVEFRLKARCEATFAHFVYGVKGVNGTTIADADVQGRILISLNPHTEFSLAKPLPRIHLNAKVRDVQFRLKDVDLRKVGILEGKFVEVLGDGFKEVLAKLL